MLAELVFLSRFLGLAFGPQAVMLKADAEVKRVELRRDGERIGALSKPPWNARIDLGRDLGPYELTAIGYGADGTEVARDTQLVNLARPAAEALILLDRNGTALSARLGWLHIAGAEPTTTVVKFDGKVVSRKATSAPIPLGDVTDDQVHVVSAELMFPGGMQVRKEIVFGGPHSEQMPAELTAVAVRKRGETPTRCIRAGGREMEPVAVESPLPQVAVIVNGGVPAWVTLARRGQGVPAQFSVVFPVLTAGDGVEMFPTQYIARHLGLREALRERRVVGKKEFAHAVAAAAMRALRQEQRRAIIYVLGKSDAADQSAIDAPAVRRYLQRVGVPLYVWSFTGPRPELAETWGEVQDVSTPERLGEATAGLRADLNSQRVAWLPAPPLDAYRATASDDCAYLPLAK
ncbi:MAG TPA: hypothetical protein VF883_04470 [Thermoanaerobaculia bacterium]|jgi:hypothetical protein